MHHVAGVRVLQRVRHLARDPERVADGKRAFPRQPVPQGLPLDVRHGVVDQVVDLVRIVEGQDMRVMEARGDLDLAQESRGSHVRGQFGAEHLQGDRAIVLEVVGEIDHGHPALAQLPLEPIAGGECITEAPEQVSHDRAFSLPRASG